ncbi:MAG: pantoate--beta-alanine ligase [Xanthomonadales bacterium]|nr:pantoate--beta-alanine ligase [Xanthomonadales bacterium]
MQVVETVAQVRDQLARWRQQGQSIALVPTMGNLHDGHMSLVDRAGELADRVCATIFVNPSQFGPGEDFEQYPRTPEHDMALLSEGGCDLLLTPSVAEMYPTGQDNSTRVRVPGSDQGLCDASRPGHFDGVATVVTALLNIFQPHVAIFGEKDFQQLMVIRRLVKDLHLPVTIVGSPTVREASGLAVSSRNRYLDEDQKQRAAAIYAALCAVRDGVQAGHPQDDVSTGAWRSMQAAGLEPEYLELRRTLDLAPASPEDLELVVLTAARMGGTRLIDNLSFPRTP